MIPEAALLMADRRWLLGRLTTRRGMILCPVDGADRDRMMSARILRGHGGSDVSTPCRSDRPGGSVTTDWFKVVRKGYTLVGARPEPRLLIAKVLERAYAVRDQFAVRRSPRQCLRLLRRNFIMRSDFSEQIDALSPFNDYLLPKKYYIKLQL